MEIKDIHLQMQTEVENREQAKQVYFYNKI